MGLNEQVSMHMPGVNHIETISQKTDVREKEINSHTGKYNHVSQRPQLTRLTNNVHDITIKLKHGPQAMHSNTWGCK